MTLSRNPVATTPPGIWYDAKGYIAEDRVYHNIAQAVPAYARYRTRSQSPAMPEVFYTAAFCYPGQCGPVTAGELWSAGGGTVRNPGRPRLHAPDFIMDLFHRSINQSTDVRLKRLKVV